MILGLEIALTIAGLYMLCTGKSWGKDTIKHWQMRLVGLFALTLYPFVFLAVLTVEVVYSLAHPDLSTDVIAQKLHWTIVGVEAGSVIVYAVVVTAWIGAVRRHIRRAAYRPVQQEQAPPPTLRPAAPTDHPMIPKDRPFSQF